VRHRIVVPSRKEIDAGLKRINESKNAEHSLAYQLQVRRIYATNSLTHSLVTQEVVIEGKGAGVIAKETITSGTFVCEYAGHLINDHDEVKRKYPLSSISICFCHHHIC
jgi:hypothetical protein